MGNDDFYTLPKNNSRKVDLLFLIANAPVETTSLPVTGSESYIGTAVTMEFAMRKLLSEKFQSFFPDDNVNLRPSKQVSPAHGEVYDNTGGQLN